MAVVPAGARANSWEDVVDLSAGFGLVLDPWQEEVLRCSMGERADGRWVSPRVGLSAPRQNGKSQLIVARALAGALLFNERKIVISAHQADTARETFAKFIELIDESPALRGRVSQVMNALNREFIKFSNGCRIQFKARTGPGARGFSSECLFLDEAQILSARSWASINSTMSAMRNPQVWLLGTPPTPEDDGDVFAAFRDAAITGKSQQATYLEWSAERADDPALEETRARANPAWFTRINRDVVQGEYETYSPEQFARERLGIWDDEDAASVIDVAAWKRMGSRPLDGSSLSPVVLAVESTLDRSQAVIVAVGTAPGDVPQVKVVASGPRTGWVASRVADIARDHDEVMAVVVDARSGLAADIQAALDADFRDVDVVASSATDMAEACAQLLDVLLGEGLRHANDAVLDAAVRGAVKRDMGDNAWAWSRRKGGPVVAPLVAMTLALWKWRQLAGLDYDVADSLG